VAAAAEAQVLDLSGKRRTRGKTPTDFGGYMVSLGRASNDEALVSDGDSAYGYPVRRSPGMPSAPFVLAPVSALLISLALAFSGLVGCSEWEPGVQREVPCGDRAAVAWTPWLHGYLGANFYDEDAIGCEDNPHVEVFSSKSEVKTFFDWTIGSSEFIDELGIDYDSEYAVLIANCCTSGGALLEVACLSENESGQMYMSLFMWWESMTLPSTTSHFTLISIDRRSNTEINAFIIARHEEVEYEWAPI
jgi:hypothetical protein